MDTATEHKAANILLKRGVKVPVTAPLFFRLLGKKTIDVVVKAPTSDTLLVIAEKYLSMRIEQTKDLTLPESFALLKNHSKTMTEIIAITILDQKRNFFKIRFFTWLLSKRLTQEELNYLFHLIVIYGGVEDFINTIRLMEAVRITKPMNLSPEEKTS